MYKARPSVGALPLQSLLRRWYPRAPFPSAYLRFPGSAGGGMPIGGASLTHEKRHVLMTVDQRHGQHRREHHLEQRHPPRLLHDPQRGDRRCSSTTVMAPMLNSGLSVLMERYVRWAGVWMSLSVVPLMAP